MCFRKIVKLHKHEFGIVRNRSVISVNDSGQRSFFSVNERTNERLTQTNEWTNDANERTKRTNERKTISKRTENEKRTKHLLSYTNQGLYMVHRAYIVRTTCVHRAYIVRLSFRLLTYTHQGLYNLWHFGREKQCSMKYQTAKTDCIFDSCVFPKTDSMFLEFAWFL